MRRVRREERGQAAVEFAVIAPLLLVILFAIMEFGLVFADYIEVESAARVGARKAALAADSGTGSSSATEGAKGATSRLDENDLTVTTTADGTWQKGAKVTVRTTYPYAVDIFGLEVSSGQLTSSSTARIQ